MDLQICKKCLKNIWSYSFNGNSVCLWGNHNPGKICILRNNVFQDISAKFDYWEQVDNFKTMIKDISIKNCKNGCQFEFEQMISEMKEKQEKGE